MNGSSLSDRVAELLQRTEQDEDTRITHAKALRDAEALADEYSDIQPATFVVPMERFLGLPVLQSKKTQASGGTKQDNAG